MEKKSKHYLYFECFETILVDLRVADMEVSKQYVVHSGKDYQYAHV
jgi:hypothetical protein